MSLYPDPLKVISWNPVTGCSPISEGCARCWAKKRAVMNAGKYGYPKRDPFQPTFHADKLDVPLKRQKPGLYAACYMGDLFHEDVPFEWQRRVFVTMIQTEHTYLLLTKRPAHMAAFMREPRTRGVWPPPNVWFGASVENQQRADERLPHLLKIDAPGRLWISIEPKLGPVRINFAQMFSKGKPTGRFRTHEGRRQFQMKVKRSDCLLGLVVLGGESGPNARPMELAWARSVIQQCREASVPVFVKQLGGYPDKRGDLSQWPEDLQVRELPEELR